MGDQNVMVINQKQQRGEEDKDSIPFVILLHF